MSMRKVAAVAIGVGAIAAMASTTTASATPGAPAAAKRADCTVTIQSPGKVKIGALHNKYAYKLSGCGNPGVYVAVAELDNSGGHFWDALGWNKANSNSVIDFRGSDYPPVGKYRIKGNNGSTCNEDPSIGCKEAGEEIHTWGPLPTTDVRYGTMAGIATSRHGSTVKITALLRRFTGTKYVPYVNRLLAFQRYNPSTKTWGTVGYGHTSSAGRVSGVIKAPSKATYRIRVTDATSYWGSASGGSHR